MSALPKDEPKLSTSAAQWLEARGLDSVLCERLGLASGVGRDGCEWLTLPFERDGRRVNRKFRKLADKAWRQDKGGEQVLWRVDCLTDKGLADQPLIITEGEFDAIAAIQAGFWRTVSVPGGAPAVATEDARVGEKYAFLDTSRVQLDPIREIIIAADNDGPGHALLSDLTALLGPARCKFVTYPEGCKDLNDVLFQHGEEGVRDAISKARWVRVAGVHKLSELPPLPPLTIWRPRVMSDLDALLPICPGHLSVWTGIPGHGKSALVNAVMWTIADRHNLRIAHGTFESTPQREYLEDLIAFRAGHPIGDAALTDDAIQAARTWCEDRIVFLVSDGYAAPQEEDLIDATLEWFFRAAQTAVVRHGCRIVVLDPWSQLEHARNSAEPETSYIQRSIRRAKSFARTFDCHVAIIAHPTKQQRVSTGIYSMPEGYDISGSAHWYNGVDLGVTIHRDPETIEHDGETLPDPNSSRVLVRAWKIKNHRAMGKPGDAYAEFDSRTGRYCKHVPQVKSQPRRWAGYE
jgi:twinkle protein